MLVFSIKGNGEDGGENGGEGGDEDDGWEDGEDDGEDMYQHVPTCTNPCQPIPTCTNSVPTNTNNLVLISCY